MGGSALALDSEPLPAGRRRMIAAGLVLLVGLELALVWAHPRLPTNDGPAHQYSAWVAHRLAADPASPLATYFERNPSVLYPNAAYSWFLEALAGRVPMPLAERAGASLYLIALPLALGWLCRALGRDPWLPAYLAAGLSLNFVFFMGFFNFLWGVPLALGFLASLQRTIAAPRVGRIVVTNLLLGATFCAHLVAFAVALIGAGALVVGAFSKRAWLALAAFLPIAAAAPFFWPRTVGLGDRWSWREGPAARALAVVAMNVASAFGGAERVLAVAFGVLLMAAAAVALLRGSRPGGWPLRLLVAALLGAAILCPSEVGAGSFLDQRLMLFFWLALAATVEPASERRRRIAIAAVAAVVVAHLVFLQGRMRRFDDDLTVYLSALPELPRGAALFAYSHVPLREEFVARPMATVHAYYHMALEAPNFSHYQAAPGDAPYFPIRYTAAGRARYPGQRHPNRIPIGRVSSWAEYVLVWGRAVPELRQIDSQGGYGLVFRRGELRLFRRVAPGAAASSPASAPTR